jgi:hypothetical protein
MDNSHSVSRTARGLTHGNTLVVRKLATVVVLLDVGQRKSNLKDSYRLRSDEGLYEHVLKRSESVPLGETQLKLRFTEVVPSGTYSLYHILAPGIEIPVFEGVPYATLHDHGDETPEPESVKTEGQTTLTPHPKLHSDDPLLAHDATDHALDPAMYILPDPFATKKDLA